MRIRFLMFLLFAAAIQLQAATIRVPQDQPTIQAGIDAAVNGDTVLVAPGSWVENIRFFGKAITLTSSGGRDVTFIESSATGIPIVTFTDGEDTTTVLDDFTIRNSINAWGINIQSASPIIQNCIVTNCHWSGDGGAIRFILSAAKIRKNRIFGNSGESTGGGVGGSGLIARQLEIIENEIYANSTANGPGIGITPGGLRARIERNIIYGNTGGGFVADGIYVYECTDCQIINNTVTANSKGISLWAGTGNRIANNIVESNVGRGIVDFSGIGTIVYNDVWNNGSDNIPGAGGISADPLFINRNLHDYHLTASSPCINAGDPNLIYNDPDGSRNDMGALPLQVVAGRIRHVPGEYLSIQEGIDAANDGDTVLVEDGRYYERINFLGKKILVCSNFILDGDTLHIYDTVIDGDTTIVPPIVDTTSVVRFVSGEDSTSVLSGLSIHNGGPIGILCSQSSFALTSCRIANCDVSIVNSNSAPEVDIVLASSHFINSDIICNTYGNVWIRSGTTAELVSGGESVYKYARFYFDSASVEEISLYHLDGVYANDLQVRGNITAWISDHIEIKNSQIGGTIFTGIESRLVADSSRIGGIEIRHESSADISNCLVVGTVTISPVSGNATDMLAFRHCTISGNIIRTQGVIFTFRLDTCNVLLTSPIEIDSKWKNVYAYCSNIFAGQVDWVFGSLDSTRQYDTLNVTSLDPLYCDTASGDYQIKNISPCAPANNSCGVLIGAYGIGCANVAPELTSSDSVVVIKRTPFVYHATSTDLDGPDAIYSFANLPVWLTSAGDSAYGTPGLNDSDADIIAIVSDGFLADSMIVHITLIETPLVGTLLVDGSSSPLHINSSMPKIEWSYLDPPGLYPQSSFEIAVSTDNDWQFAEMWNPAPFASADTFVVYSGAPLLDGHSYWLRLRVSNSLGWSNWSELMFRMNSVPTAPQLRLPANNSIVASQFPNLTIRNPFDAESDSMFLTIEISADSFATSFFPFQSVPSIDSLTTVAVPVMLNENARFWWRVKASDYYEESAYSPIWSFWVNSSNTAPSAFSLLSPPNTQSPTLADNTPEFTWQPSFDCDPGDSVKFTLQLSIDASFSFASQIPGLTNPQYVPTKPLEWGRRYWWRVKAEDKSTGVTWSNEVFSFTTMRLGDPDGNGIVTISDAVFLINYIFSGGPEPNPLSSGDADCNGIVTISDAVYLINYIFAGGAAPCGAGR